MSTNAKNIIRKEFLKNFTRKVKDRYILLEKGDFPHKRLEETLGLINSKVNVMIQELNLAVAQRQVPYIHVKACYGDLLNKRVRVFLRHYDTSAYFEQEVQKHLESDTEISHILDFVIAECFKKITISSLACDAELVIDPQLFPSAAVDILLDIAMFNSYSFLKKMTIEEKKRFSQQKYAFFKEQKLPCFYDCPEDKMIYYSLAFSARKSEEDFDFEAYLAYWDRFIATYYPHEKHREKSIRDQLRQHVDYEELPQNLPARFNVLEPGAYLLLRTNTDRTEDLHPLLFSLFGIKRYRKGKIKIVPISEFDRYKPLLEHLDVSAFKVVKEKGGA